MSRTPAEAAPIGWLATDRIAAIDGLRALAFLLVFAFHTWEFAGHPYVPVISAVVSQNTRPNFFVVLTGFVLALPFARNPARKLDTAVYLRRRIRRIVLPYYAALLFAALLPQALVLFVRLVGGEASWQPWPTWENWAWHLTFLHIFSPEYWAGINGSLWTMSLEMQLYLLFPLVLAVIMRWKLRGIIAVLAVTMVYRLVAGLLTSGQGFPIEFLVGANGLGRLQEFLAGMLCAALIYRRGLRNAMERWLLVLGLIAGYALAVSPVAALTMLSVRELGLSLAFSCLIALVLTSRVGTGVFGARPVSWIGYRAYSLFLIHQPLMWFFGEFLKKVIGLDDGVVLLAVLWTVGLGVTVVVGQVFFLLIERPCIAWAKRAPRGRRGDASARPAE